MITPVKQLALLAALIIAVSGNSEQLFAQGSRSFRAAGGSDGSGGDVGTFPDLSVMVNGVERDFRLLVPETINLNRPIPLVFAFHGFWVDNKDKMPIYTGLSELAVQEEFIVVYPNSEAGYWRTYLFRNPDIDFFDVLLSDLATLYNIDLDRVYVVGMSNGANFVNVLASKRSEQIAAIAPHSGTLGRLEDTGIRAQRKYPVMMVTGAQDQLVPVEDARAARDQYIAEGHPVAYFEFDNLAHGWAREYDITAVIWEFFKANPIR